MLCAYTAALQVGNFFIISFNELIAEGMTLGEKNGIGRPQVAQFLERFFPGPFTKGGFFQIFLLPVSFTTS
jgi:hypothetical protein